MKAGAFRMYDGLFFIKLPNTNFKRDLIRSLEKGLENIFLHLRNFKNKSTLYS